MDDQNHASTRLASARRSTKGSPVSCRFPALGVVFDCSCLEEGAFIVEDKPGRVHTILQVLAGAAAAGVLSPAEAAAVKGRLQYTRSQTFGRTGGPGLQALMLYEKGQPWRALTLREIEEFWRSHIRTRRPRKCPRRSANLLC